MLCIADLASVTNGRERDLIDVLYRHYPEVRSGTVALLVTDPGLFSEFRAEVIAVPDGATTDRDRFVIDNVDDAIAKAPTDERVLVGSFRTVLEYHLAQNRTSNRQVDFLDFRHLLRLTSGKSTGQLDSWPLAFMPLDEALNNLTAAVRAKGTLKQTQLRGALEKENPAWTKIKGRNAPQDDSKIISIIVNEGVAKGAIALSGNSNDPYISLAGTDGSRGTVGAVTVRGATAGQRTPTSATIAGGVVDPASGGRDSDRYIRALRDGQLGPYQEVRTAVYDAIDNILADRAGAISIRDLISQAVDTVRESIEAARLEGRQYLINSMTRNLPWGAVKAFVTLLMIRQPVIQTVGGDLVTADWTNLSKSVEALVPDWQVILDSDLIVFLISRGFTINAYSEEDLSGALFDNRRAVEKVERCIAYLIEKRICELSPEYSLRILEARHHHTA